MENFKHQTLERLGFETAYIDQFTTKIIQRLKSRKNLRWLSEKTIEEEIKQFYSDKNMRLYWGVPQRVHRIICQKMSAFILKKCANEHGLNLTNITSNNHSQFIVHDYMNPYVLFEKHTERINKVLGEKSFWHSKNHTSWTHIISSHDELIANMVEQFESAFAGQLEQKKIQRISQKTQPLNSTLYQIDIPLFQ